MGTRIPWPFTTRMAKLAPLRSMFFWWAFINYSMGVILMACQKHFAHIPKPKREGRVYTLHLPSIPFINSPNYRLIEFPYLVYT